jgi:hypothetical protein
LAVVRSLAGLAIKPEEIRIRFRIHHRASTGGQSHQR